MYGKAKKVVYFAAAVFGAMLVAKWLIGATDRFSGGAASKAIGMVDNTVLGLLGNSGVSSNVTDGEIINVGGL